MNMVRFLVLLSTLLVAQLVSLAQDTLPDFTVTTRGNNRTIISWTNQFPVIKQISIQRSVDSTRNYKTILTVPDPTVPQNGFVDTKAQTPYMFYRLFIVLDSGKYVFSKPRRPTWDTTRAAARNTAKSGVPVDPNKQVVVSSDMSKQDVEELKEKLEVVKNPEPAKVVEKFFVVLKRDTVVAQIPEKNFKNFRDSLVNRTRDTMLFVSVDTILIKSFVPKVVYKPSQFVYTERDGNVTISLPRALQKKYSIKFFEDNNDPLFEIKHVRESQIILDKANFLHAGWFRFELYEDGELKEKHRFYIPKDF